MGNENPLAPQGSCCPLRRKIPGFWSRAERAEAVRLRSAIEKSADSTALKYRLIWNRGIHGPFTFPWELQEIARTFGRANSAITKWRAELEACGAASYLSGSWTLPVPEFFRETSPISQK